MRFSPVRVIAPSGDTTSQIYVYVGTFAVGSSISLLIPADASKPSALFCLVCSEDVKLPWNNYIGGQVLNVGAVRACTQI